MIVNFIESGFMITSVEMDFPPDNEDRVVIFGIHTLLMIEFFILARKI